MIAAVGESRGCCRCGLQTWAHAGSCWFLGLDLWSWAWDTRSASLADGTPNIHDGLFEGLKDLIVRITEPGISLVVNGDGKMVMGVEFGKCIGKECCK